MLILLTLALYFLALLAISRWTAGKKSNNEMFFRAGRRSPWYLVAFGMVGASMSGVTFVSVPGMVNSIGMTYMQMVLGFVLGYFVIAFVLLPIYYREGSATIYAYLKRRFGGAAYKTGAWFFLISKMTGAAARFYIVCLILQRFLLDGWGVGFPVTAFCMVALIWLYTRQGGIKTLVITDTFQTAMMLLALLFITVSAFEALGLPFSETVKRIWNAPESRVFVFDDWLSRQNFFKQFLSGAFVAIVMTGLDQDMMQKNLTCRTLREAKKDMCSYGMAFVPANLMFLVLGVLLTMLAREKGLSLPEQGDELLPMFAATGQIGGSLTVVFFTVGIIAASFSSADSALTALATSYSVDICEKPEDERLRRRAHIGVAAVFYLFILLFHALNSTSVIDAIYILCSYTYGPLLGLFAFGLMTRRRVRSGAAVPLVCVLSPLVCFIIDMVSDSLGYRFGYEMLMLNGLLTFLGLSIFSSRTSLLEVQEKR